MKIVVDWEVSVLGGTEHFDLSDMNCETVEQWEALTNEEQKARMQEALDRLPERAFIHLTNYNFYE